MRGLPALREVDVDRETEFDGWADLSARRRAEDEQLIRRYAHSQGRGLPIRPVRAFVQHVRRDLGPKAIICEVRMTTGSTGHEVCAWYYFPPEGGHGLAAAPQAVASLADVPTLAGDPPAAMPRAPSHGLPSLARSSAAVPASPGRHPVSATAPARLTPHTSPPPRSGPALSSASRPQPARHARAVRGPL
jgi:hypothetical protein